MTVLPTVMWTENVKCHFIFTSLFQRMNMDSRKSPKLSRANQEGQRSPRLPTKKPPIRSPSLTRREFSMDGITEVWRATVPRLICYKVYSWHVICFMHQHILITFKQLHNNISTVLSLLLPSCHLFYPVFVNAFLFLSLKCCLTHLVCIVVKYIVFGHCLIGGCVCITGNYVAYHVGLQETVVFIIIFLDESNQRLVNGC